MTAPSTPLLSAPAQPLRFLLAAWSMTTTQTDKFRYWNNRPYRDTPRSRWEAMRAAAVPKKASR